MLSFFDQHKFSDIYINEADVEQSIWLYGIHSDNPEMIYLLEENEIQPPNESYEECIKESIKCHHNDVANLFQSNLIEEDICNADHIDFEENYVCFHYNNFSYFPEEIKNKIFFYYANMTTSKLLNIY